MNEFDFINRIRERAQKRVSSPQLVRGIGDDAAVFRPTPGSDVVISADLLVEDVDFRRDWVVPRLLGQKALAVSLSDIAAMGARPRWAILSLGIPPEVWSSGFPDQAYGGIFELADQFDVKLIGGDTSQTPDKIVIDSVLVGECVRGGAILRGGAQPGDQIFLTGSLGAAAAGLRLLERGARVNQTPDQETDAKTIETIVLRHLCPEPRVGWGIVLGQEQLASAMIDVSDGLSSDLNHLCSESGVGALIDAAGIPIDQRVVELCGHRALDPLQLALHGGDDLELLFTVRADKVSLLPRKVDGVSVTRVGEIKEAAAGVRIAEGSRIWNLAPGGWTHFNSEASRVAPG